MFLKLCTAVFIKPVQCTERVLAGKDSQDYFIFLKIFPLAWMEVPRQFQPSGSGSVLNLLQGLVYAVDHGDREWLIPLH